VKNAKPKQTQKRN